MNLVLMSSVTQRMVLWVARYSVPSAKLTASSVASEFLLPWFPLPRGEALGMRAERRGIMMGVTMIVLGIGVDRLRRWQQRLPD